MNTLIKGTFPVRFRKDGKDGVNVWLKYASVLDLTDSNTGKSYPSKIYNEPTAECKFIGIGKGVGDEPTQGQYYEWKKYVGDDGTSFTPKGRAIAHYTTLTAYNNASKSVGLYLIDDSAGALLKYWNGSSSVNRSVVDGDGYTTADKHLWVKDGVKWNDLGEIQGPKGDPGDDAYSYKLRSNITAIPLDNNGMPVDSAKSLTLTGNIFKGSSSISVSTSYTIRAIITWNGTASDTKTSSNGSLTVDLSTYKNIVKVACSFLYGSTVLDSFDILPIKAGAAGVSYFPNNRGYWVINSTYSWSTENMSRDMVVFNIGGTPYLFAVKTAGKSFKSTVSPDKDTNNWEKASSPYSMLFANFVYTDNASVAGFKWSDEVMQSPNGLLELNGKTGKITAKSGKIGVVNISSTGALVTPYWNITADGKLWCSEARIIGEITATSGTFDNCTINETCKAGFMKYATDKFNGNIINCGFVNFYAGWGITGSTTLYLPSVSEGEYMKIIVSNFVTTKVYLPDFTLAVEGNGTLHDLFNYPLGVYTKKTLSIGRMVYYEFTGLNEQGHSRWICTNSMFT